MGTGRHEKDEAALMVALDDVWAKIAELAQPLEPVEVSLSEAVGLVLAEPAVADVDLPPFDRAAAEGYAVRSAEATPGALLRVIAQPTTDDSEFELEGGESALVAVGAALPMGADSVLSVEQVRSESGSGGPRVVEVVEPATPGRRVATRGGLLRAGDKLLDAGTRLTPAMVGLLASQGCVHPLCHRRVRVAILAIGDHLVGPIEAPILHRERNAANLALTSLLIGAGAMVHDLGCVSEADAVAALDRGTTAPVVIALGEFTGGLLRHLAREGVEPVMTGLDFLPGRSVQYGLVRDSEGFPSSHLLHFPLDPVEAVLNTALVALPLIARLQGSNAIGPERLRAVWSGPGVDELTAIPVSLTCDREARLHARPVTLRGRGDLPSLALANGVALVQPGGEEGEQRLIDAVAIGSISTC